MTKSYRGKGSTVINTKGYPVSGTGVVWQRNAIRTSGSKLPTLLRIDGSTDLPRNTKVSFRISSGKEAPVVDPKSIKTVK